MQQEITIRKIRIVQLGVSAEVAKKLAEDIYSQFRVIQDQNYLSDFDKEIGKIKNNL